MEGFSIDNLYVVQLKDDLQVKIKNELIFYFKDELGLDEEEIKSELELAMSSRVNDLEDTINIKEIINNN